MVHLIHQRCYHHSDREAVARCPECSRFYCRECITEHDDRMLCATCLSHLSASQDASRLGRLYWLVPLLQFGGGLLLIWVLFFYIGSMLIAMPTTFHEGTFWEQGG